MSEKLVGRTKHGELTLDPVYGSVLFQTRTSLIVHLVNILGRLPS